MKQLGKILIGAVLLVAMTAGFLQLSGGQAEKLSQVQAQQQTETPPTRTVQVTGMGEVKIEPDTAVVRLGVQTDADTAQVAMSQNNSAMVDVVDALESAKIPSRNIQTQTIRLSPRYSSGGPNNEQTLQGYTASNVVEVRTSDLGTLGTLLDQAVKAGANTIENFSFDTSNSQDVNDQARQAAVEDARHKAEQLAELTNATLGPVLEIQETSSTTPVARQFESPASVAAAVPISPGSQSVITEMQVTWTLIVSGE